MLHHNLVQCRRVGKARRRCCTHEMRSVCCCNHVAAEWHRVDKILLMQLLYHYLMAAQVLEHMQRKQWRWLSAGTLHLSPSPSKSWIDACYLNLLSQRQSWPRGSEGGAQTHPRHASFAFYFSRWRRDSPSKMRFVVCRLEQRQQEKKRLWGLLTCLESVNANSSLTEFSALKSLISKPARTNFKRSKCWKIASWCKCASCPWKI